MTPLELVIDRLQQRGEVKERGGKYHSLCPAHDDHNPSLDFEAGDDGRVLLTCRTGCTFEAIVHALGLKPKDLFPDSNNGGSGKHAAPVKANLKTTPKAKTKLSPIIAEYFYKDADGIVRYRVTRHEPMPDEPKPFRQWRPDGRGDWILGIKGYVDPLPYRLPDVLVAVNKGSTVYIAEGEKDVHTLESHGLTATCNPGGAGKWQASYSEYLRGVPVVIFEDNDQSGRTHAQDVAAKTSGIASSVKLVSFPDLPEKGDVSDWLAQGHPLEELLARVDQADEWTPTDEPAARILSLSDLLTGTLKPVSWIVQNLVPSGGITMLAGDSGVGKSWVGYHLALCVAAGRRFLGHFNTQAAPVLVFDCENGEPLIRRRVIKLHAGLGLEGESVPSDLPLRVAVGPLRLDSEKERAWLIDLLKRESIGLVVADPLVHCLPEGTSENDSTSMAAFFTEVRKVQAETGCAFVFTHHARKRSFQAPNDAGQMIRGSSAIRAILDSHLFFSKLPSGSLLCEHDKNRHSEVAPKFILQISDSEDRTATTLEYAGETDATTDQTAVAFAFIERSLTDAGGSLKRKDLLEQAKPDGLKTRTVCRALTTGLENGSWTKTQDGKETVYSLSIEEDE